MASRALVKGSKELPELIISFLEELSPFISRHFQFFSYLFNLSPKEFFIILVQKLAH